MTARASETSPRAPHDIAIVGSDLLLQALPARPVQVSHALLAAGYSLVVPASWGDELLAEYAIRQVVSVDPRPRVYCACPRVRQRLLATGDELAPHLLSLVAPPVACARYLRQAWPDEALRITYIGGCEAGKDSSIDLHVTPSEMLERLEGRGIHPDRMPTAFRDVIPPDRRRHWSLAGGCPAPEALEAHDARTELRIVGVDAFPQDVVEGLLGGRPVLLDVADALDCACAGAVHLHGVTAAREAVTALEPPRSPVPVLDADLRIDLEYRPRLVLSRAASGSPEGTSSTATVTARSPSHPAAPEDQPPLPPPQVPAPDVTTPPPGLAVRRAIAVTPPGVAVTASREEGRPSPPQQLLGPRAVPGGVTNAPPMAPVSLSAAQQRHRVARAAARVRGMRGDMARAARAVASRRQGSSAIDAPAAPPGSPAGTALDAPAAPAESPAQPATRVPIVPEVVAADAVPAADAAAVTGPAAPALSGPIDTMPRSPSRPRFAPIPPPPPARPRRLWGLLATVTLILAITVLLVAVFAL